MPRVTGVNAFGMEVPQGALASAYDWWDRLTALGYDVANMSEQDRMIALGKAGLQTGTEMAAMSGAGLAGLTRYGMTGSLDKGVETLQQATDIIPTYRSDDPQAQTAYDLITTAEEPIEFGAQKLGEGALALTDSPEAAAATYTAASMLLPGRAKGGKRSKTTGQYVGAPKGTTTPQKVTKMVDQYADRVEQALDADVDPGYFYERGAESIERVTDSPREASEFALTNAITSSEAPVRSNVGWAIKGMEQEAMGVPIETGMYPVKARENIEKVFAGETQHLGEKRQLYGGGLLADDTPGPDTRLAPNDRWEIRGFGYEGKSAGAPQHKFMHDVRQDAVDVIEERRGIKLTPLEAQELNWHTVRNEAMGDPLGPEHVETVQDAIKDYTFQHSWESAPGAAAGHFPEYTDMSPRERQALHKEYESVLLDDSGKDRLVRAMGGRLQEPAISGPGLYQGEISPGTQSRSLVQATQSKGLDPTSRARVEGTEATRALLLGQEAGAGHVPIIEKTKKRQGMLQVEGEGTISESQARNLVSILDKEFGEGNVGYVPTERGANIADFSGQKDFQKRLGALSDDIGEVLPGEQTPYKFEGIYEPLVRYDDDGNVVQDRWDEGTATEYVLGRLDSDDAPALAEHADSAEMRQLAGDIHEMYQGQSMTPNPKLMKLLETWRDDGMKGVRRLVSQGLAPAAAVVAILNSPQEENEL